MRDIHIDKLADQILAKTNEVPAGQAMLAGISGIDASGKGYISSRLAEILSADHKVALINADGWLNLPSVRFSDTEPAKHFYENAFRSDEMFRNLILPLKNNRSIDLTADQVEETSTSFHRHRYHYENIDIVLLEGIFLFKKAFVKHFDLRVWVECGFETAMKRAIARSQEQLSPEQTIEAYETIYFPAQRLHFEIDKPQASADLSMVNT